MIYVYIDELLSQEHLSILCVCLNSAEIRSVCPHWWPLGSRLWRQCLPHTVWQQGRHGQTLAASLAHSTGQVSEKQGQSVNRIITSCANLTMLGRIQHFATMYCWLYLRDSDSYGYRTTTCGSLYIPAILFAVQTTSVKKIQTVSVLDPPLVNRAACLARPFGPIPVFV